MIAGRYIANYLLKSKSQRPIKGILRNFFYSLIFTLLVLMLTLFFPVEISLKYFYSILVISCFIFYLGWGAERLWYAFISPIFNDPFSMKAFLSRIPFWFISGGVALSASSLIVYKLQLVDLITWTRQYVIFLYGGILNWILQIPLQYYTYISITYKINKSNLTSNYEKA